MDVWVRASAMLLILLGGPALALGAQARWRRPAAWLGVGALTFTGAQALRWPLLAGLTVLFQRGWLPRPSDPHILNLVILSLSAGLFEETARWLGMRWAHRRQTRAGKSLDDTDILVLGLAHGGTEAFWVGLLGWIQLIVMRLMQEGVLPIPPGMEGAVTAYWATPAWLPWVGALERGMAILIHIGFAFLIAWGIRRRQPIGWGAAVLLHTLVDGTVGYVRARWGMWGAEGMAALWALASGLMILRARRSFSGTPSPVR
ncbi:YhfC family glutamic-type intramembrane protease [Thermoflexus sp.]|uniref:YhfC family glutamic-type intramembrane protease n=1 Tax=Thermoflexus sp. TaxID=1969742 RepID=UPI001827BBC6|nr:YhfC family glutamic-type intramembrane protease [Thermoflexus sp.]